MGASSKSAKSKKAKEKSSASSATVVGTLLRDWFFRPGTLIVAAGLAVMVVLGPYTASLLPDLSKQPEYQFPVADMQINKPNSWVPATILEDVLKDSQLPETVCLLNPNLCRDVAVVWKQSPWVKRVESVRITPDPSLKVVLEYRAPVAFVEVEQGLYPIDSEGVLLPPADFSISDASRLPHIANIRSQPSGGAGEPWGDLVVESAARLAAVLAPEQNLEIYWNRFQLEAIVAPDVDPRTVAASSLIFELKTQGGSRIVWGKPPGADDLEPTVEQKLARLDQYISRFGSFDSPNGPNRVDIRLFDAISLQPLYTR